MISHNQKEQLKEEAKKARHAQAMRSLQPPPTMNATLFNEPRRVQQNSDTPIMSHIQKVLGNYQEGVEEIGKRSGHIYDIEKNIRSSSRDANNHQKYKVRLNGVNRPPLPPPPPNNNNNSVPSGRGQDSRHGTSDLSQIMHDESKLYQNSSSSLPSKESGHVRNSLDAGSHNRSSQSLRQSSSSRQPSDKYSTEKDGSSSLTYQQKNKYAHSYINLNHKSHSSSSSSSVSSSHNHPSGLGSSSGGGGTKSSRPLSSIGADLHHSGKPAVHSSSSEKNYSDKHHQSSGASDKHHGSNITKTYTDLKVHNEKHQGDVRGHAISDGKSHSSSIERTIAHSSSSKGRSLSPASLPPPKLQPQLTEPLLPQSQRQGPPLLQPQQNHQQQQQQLPPQLQHQQPPTIIPVTTGSAICDENHHGSPSISPTSVFNATNNNRMKSLPSQLTPQHTTKSSKLSPPILPENLFSGEDNVVNRIVREMTSQPEKLTAIKTPIKSALLRVKKKPEKDKTVSSGDKVSMPNLSLNQNPCLKNRSRLQLPPLEIPKNFHVSNANNLSPDDTDLTEMKDKNELDKIIAEMTCIKSPISIILTPEKIKNAQLPFPKNINSDLAVSDSEGSVSDADERRPSDEKPCNSSSSDERMNLNVKQLDLSQEKEAITEEVKNHMPLMLSPMVDDGPLAPLNVDPSRGQEDLSQDLQMSDSDNESIKSGASPSSRHRLPPLICDVGLKMRKDSSGFDIPALSGNDSDYEMEDVCKNPAADVHNSVVPSEVAATTDPTHFYGTPKLCAPTARKGSRESPHKTSDNEESDDDSEDDDDNGEEKEIKSEDEGSAVGSEALQEKEADQGSSCSTSCTESTEDESDGSDEEEEPHLSPSPPSDPAKPTTEGEHCDSSSSIQKSPTLSWGLSCFITKPLETKKPKVTDPQNKSESDNCSSVANSNLSSPSNKDSSDDSSSDSSNSDSDQENPSHTSLPNASPDKSSLLSNSEELPNGSDHLKRSIISSSAMDDVTPANKKEALVSDVSTKVTPTVISASSMTTTTTSTTTNTTSSSTTKFQDWPSVKIQKENVTLASTPMSVSPPTSSSVDRKRKRKVMLPICINVNLLSPSPYKKPKLSPEPSQPAENFNADKLEPVPCSQSSPPPKAAVDKKISPPNLQKQEKIASANSRLKRPVMVKINVNLMDLVPKNCKVELLPLLKCVISKSPAGLASPSATNKTFIGFFNSGASTPKSAPSKLLLTSEITGTTATTITPTATTPPLPPPLPTTKAATPPPPSSSSSSTILSSNTSMVTATSKTVLPILAPPSTTSTVSTLEKDFNFRIPKRNADSDSQEHRLKMMKIDVQSSKSETKTADLVKADPSKKSDIAASKSSTLPPPENLFVSNKGNKLSKELKPISTKSGQTCHDNSVNPTQLAVVDENSNSMPNPNSVLNDKTAKENLSAPSISLSSKVPSDSSKDMTKAATASSSNSTPSSSSSSAVVPSSSASKLSSSSSGASSAANITDPRLTVPATTSSSLNTNSNSTSTGDSNNSSSSSSNNNNSSSSSSNNTSSSKRSSDTIRSGRPPVKLQTTTGSSSGGSSSSSSSSKQKNSVSSYFQEATRMKHEGNKKTDVFEKAYLYMQSVVYYVLCGIAMEKSRKDQDCQKMFTETFELLGQIGHYHQYQQEQKLAVLRLLLMSAICKKLYDVKKKVAENLRQVLDEHYKQYSTSTSTSATTNAHTPSPVRPNLNISTPSSRSTPSPSGSIDSIRSQGSSTSDARLTPSATSANVSTSSSSTTTTNITSSSTPSSSINPHSSSTTNSSSSSSSSSQTVVIPKRIHSITRNYMEIMDYLAKAHHYSDQAAIQRDNCKDFIELLNSRCKTISLQSSISEHVEYVKAGLQLLQNS